MVVSAGRFRIAFSADSAAIRFCAQNVRLRCDADRVAGRRLVGNEPQRVPAIVQERDRAIDYGEVEVGSGTSRHDRECGGIAHRALAIRLANRDRLLQAELAGERHLLFDRELVVGELRRAQREAIEALVVVLRAERGIRERSLLDRALLHRAVARVRGEDLRVASPDVGKERFERQRGAVGSARGRSLCRSECGDSNKQRHAKPESCSPHAHRSTSAPDPAWHPTRSTLLPYLHYAPGRAA